MPYTYTWVGGAFNGPTDATIASNWQSDVPPPFPGYPQVPSTPTSTSDVYFKGSVSHLSCNFAGFTSVTQFKSFHLVDNYQGTVTNRAFVTEALEVTSGTLTPYGPSLGDITTTSTFDWSGGELNPTSYYACIHVSGGAGTITPPSGEDSTLTTGTTISFEINQQ